MDNLKELYEKKKGEQKKTWQKIGDVNKQIKEQQKTEGEKIDKITEDKLIKKIKIYENYYKKKEIDKDSLVQKRLYITSLNAAYNANQPKTPEILSPKLYDADDYEPKPPTEKKEVAQRLRQLQEVVTYFGETDWQRYKRLQQCEVHLFESTYEVGDQTEGKEVQVFRKLTAEEMNQRMQAQDESIQVFLNKLNKQEDQIVNPQKHYQHRQAREFEMELLKEGTYESKCDDVYVWCKNILKQWELKLMEKYDNETKKRSLEGSKAIGIYSQSFDYIKPLAEMLKKRKINEEILNSLYCIIRYCILKEYVRAHDKYLELAIGNAPWPMGVTMVGIHERSGRAKIFSSQIAHILNDETQRKYIQSIKRLITFSQKFHPNSDPSKMVDFLCEVTL